MYGDPYRPPKRENQSTIDYLREQVFRGCQMPIITLAILFIAVKKALRR